MYSLWLCPADTTDSIEIEIRSAMSSIYNTEIHAFPPHVTVGTLDVLDLTRIHALVERFQPIRKSIGRVEFNADPSNMFQCVYFRVDMYDEIMTMRKALGIQQELKFPPHLSLVYGSIDNSKRQEIATQFSSSVVIGKEFLWDKLVIVQTRLDAGQEHVDIPWMHWRYLETFEFHGSEKI
jgi:hypothetical protein